MKSRATSRWMPLLIATRLLCVTAAAADPDSAPAQPPVWKSGTHRLTLDGRDRTFMLDVPSKLKPGAPLVMVFHGFTSSAKDFASGADDLWADPRGECLSA